MSRYEISTAQGSAMVRVTDVTDDIQAAAIRGLRRIYKTKTATLGGALVPVSGGYEGTACRVGGAVLGRVNVYPRG